MKFFQVLFFKDKFTPNSCAGWQTKAYDELDAIVQAKKNHEEFVKWFEKFPGGMVQVVLITTEEPKKT